MSKQLTIDLQKAYPELNPTGAKTIAAKFMRRSKKQRQQSGAGWFDGMVSGYVDLINKQRNKPADPRSHKLKEGEKHAVFVNKEGAFATAKYAGPGTDLLGNLKLDLAKNDNDITKVLDKKNYISDVDRVALKHDIAYQLHGKDPDKIRQADIKFLNKLEELRKQGESEFNVGPSYAGVSAKVKLEDFHIIPKGSFASGDTEGIPKEDLTTLQKIEEHLDMLGYGKARRSTARKYRPLRGGADNDPVMNSIRRVRDLYSTSANHLNLIQRDIQLLSDELPEGFVGDFNDAFADIRLDFLNAFRRVRIDPQEALTSLRQILQRANNLYIETARILNRHTARTDQVGGSRFSSIQCCSDIPN